MRMCHPTEGNRHACNPAFTFGLSHAAGRVLTLTAGPADGPIVGPRPVRKGRAAPLPVSAAAGLVAAGAAVVMMKPFLGRVCEVCWVCWVCEVGWERPRQATLRRVSRLAEPVRSEASVRYSTESLVSVR